MKRAITIAAVTILLASTIWSGAQMFAQLFGGSAETPIPAVAWYKLDGNALDSSGNGYNGSWDGTEAYATGKYGQCGSFNGSSGISTVGQTIIPAGPVTIVAWAKFDRHINYQAIAGAGILASRVSGIGLNGSDTKWVAQNRAGIAFEGANTNHVSTADWTHLAAVRNGIDLRLYVNGVLSAVTASTNAAAADVRFAIGQRYSAEVVRGFPLDGSVDDVRIYNRALSPANIARIMESQDKAPLEELQ